MTKNNSSNKKPVIIAAIIATLGIYLYFIRSEQKNLNDNYGRRSGIERRKSFIASKNLVRRSDTDRRQTPDRRETYRYA